MMDMDALESALDAVTAMQATSPINETKVEGVSNGILDSDSDFVLSWGNYYKVVAQL